MNRYLEKDMKNSFRKEKSSDSTQFKGEVQSKEILNNSSLLLEIVDNYVKEKDEDINIDLREKHLETNEEKDKNDESEKLIINTASGEGAVKYLKEENEFVFKVIKKNSKSNRAIFSHHKEVDYRSISYTMPEHNEAKVYISNTEDEGATAIKIDGNKSSEKISKIPFTVSGDEKIQKEVKGEKAINVVLNSLNKDKNEEQLENINNNLVKLKKEDAESRSKAVKNTIQELSSKSEKLKEKVENKMSKKEQNKLNFDSKVKSIINRVKEESLNDIKDDFLEMVKKKYIEDELEEVIE